MTDNLQPLCYFLSFDNGKIKLKDHDLRPLDVNSMSGLYSFIHYNQPQLLVIGELKDYGSQHSGLAAVVDVLKKQWNNLRHKMFFHKNESLPAGKPRAGGGLFIIDGVIILWHLKSGSFSLSNHMCHDDNSTLKDLVSQIGLPEECFISVAEAEKFEKEYLKHHFDSQGKLIYPHISNDLIHHLQDIFNFKYKETNSILESSANNNI